MTSGIKGAFGQAFQVVLGKPQFIAWRFLERILVKFQGQLGQAFGQLAIALAVLALQIGTAAHKAVVGLAHQHAVLHIMPLLVEMVMDVFHTLPQLLVEGDAVEVLTQHGCHALAHSH